MLHVNLMGKLKGYGGLNKISLKGGEFIMWLRDKKGFTLIELMIVVAIIGILAAIAIPQFLKFQAKSKQSEARTILSGIYTAETAYFAEKNQFAQATSNPTGTTPLAVANNFTTIGYVPASVPKYYKTFWASFSPAQSTNRFVAKARGNIDTDSYYDRWWVSDTIREPQNISNDVANQ